MCNIMPFFPAYCSAETESKAYRMMAVYKGISMDDTDEEWEEQGKETEQKQDFKKWL